MQWNPQSPEYEKLYTPNTLFLKQIKYKGVKKKKDGEDCVFEDLKGTVENKSPNAW